jgi:hypothetical protein
VDSAATPESRAAAGAVILISMGAVVPFDDDIDRLLASVQPDDSPLVVRRFNSLGRATAWRSTCMGDELDEMEEDDG